MAFEMKFDDGNILDDGDASDKDDEEYSESDESEAPKKRPKKKAKGKARPKAGKSSKKSGTSRKMKKASGTRISARSWNSCAVPNLLE